MALTLERVDGPYTLSVGSTAYTGHSVDGVAGDDKFAYSAHIFYRTTAAALNVSGVGWVEIVDNHVGESQSDGVWYGAIRARAAIPSGDPLVTMPVGMLEGYFWVCVYKHHDEWTEMSEESDDSYSSDPIVVSQQIYDPNGVAPGSPVLLLSSFALMTIDNPFTGAPTLSTNLGGNDPTRPTRLTTIFDKTQTLSSTATMRVRFFGVYSNLSNNYEYALDYTMTQDVTDGEVVASGFGVFIGNPMIGVNQNHYTRVHPWQASKLPHDVRNIKLLGGMRDRG